MDVGCALGYFVKVALNEGFDAYGVDFSEYAVEKAKSFVGDRVRRADVETEIPFEANYFDAITAWDVLEHLRSPRIFLKNVSKVLKQNGYIFITTLNYDSLLSRIMKDRWSFIGPGYHQTHTITATVLKNWLDSARMKALKMQTFGLAVDSFSSGIKFPVVKELTYILEKVLRLEIQGITRLLAPFNLGDTILCVATRT